MPDGPPRVFLSYRREETSHLAGRLSDRLVARFGPGQVFTDVDSVRPGVDFAQEIERAVGACDVLLALIGRTWATITNERGRRRIDAPDDWVALEISVALQRNIKVVPVLVDGAAMPRQDELPIALKELSLRQAARIDYETFRSDAEALVNDFVVLEPDPFRGMLSDSITRFYPFSVVEVSLGKRGEFEDDPPTKVVDFDDNFSRFFGYASKAAALKDAPLTLGRLLDRIKRYVDPDDWEKFSEEQNKLTDSTVKHSEPAKATVPIRINRSHPFDQFKCKSFLPCMTASATDADGNLDGSYRMYLLIAYIDMG
jgi:hypothetical protein